MLNQVNITGYLNTSLEWSRDSVGNRMCAFKIFHRKRTDTDPFGVLYVPTVRIYKKDLLDRLTLGIEKGDFLLICGSLAAYDDKDRIRHDFIIAHAIFNLSHCAGSTLEDVRLERQRQLAKMVEDSLTKESCESEFGANIW
jgi:hypothetical protein